MALINDLYLTYKSSIGLPTENKNRERYSNAVEKVFKESNPILHPDLEYIISSSRGLELFNQYTEKYGLPIEAIEKVIPLLEHRKSLIDQKISEGHKKLFEAFTETQNRLQEVKNKWSAAFMMFERFKDPNTNYSKVYYEYALDKKVAPQRLLNKYGLGIVPDLVVFNHEYLKNKTLIESLVSRSLFFDQNSTQWLFESIKPYGKSSDEYELLYELSYNKELKDLWNQERSSFIESVVLRDFSRQIEFSEEAVNFVQNFIDFKESFAVLAFNPAIKAQSEKEINKARELKANLEDSAPLIADYLQTPVVENIFDMSGDKKPGNVPDYIRKNYNVDYDDKEKPEEEPNLDQSQPLPDNGMNAYKRTEPEPEPEEPSYKPSRSSDEPSADNSKQINYYYYNYSNSFNKHHDNSLRYADSSKHGSVEYSDSKQIGNVQHHVGSHNKSYRTSIDKSNEKDSSYNTSKDYSKNVDIDADNIDYDKSMGDEIKAKNGSTINSGVSSSSAYKDSSKTTSSSSKSNKSANYNGDNNSIKDNSKTKIKQDIQNGTRITNKNNKEKDVKKESISPFLLETESFF